MKKSYNLTQITRRIIQLIFFVFFTGLVALSFGNFKGVYNEILNGKFNFSALMVAFTPVLIIIFLDIFAGRFFCGWLCAFGSLNDFLYLFSKKVLKIKYKISPEVDKALKFTKYIILAFIVYFVWTINAISLDSISPWTAFGQFTDFGQSFFDYPIAFVLLAAICIGAMFIERFFCRYLCPLGAIQAILSKLRLTHIYKPTAKCGKCRMCTINCPMGIELYKYNDIRSGECISCLKCEAVCPRGNARLSVLRKRINNFAYAIVSLSIFSGLYAAGKLLKSSNVITNTAVTTENNVALGNSSDNSSDTQQQTQKYKDGVYTGVGTGFRPGLTVSVTIKNNNITNIEIVSHHETRGYSEEPMQIVPQEIIQSQSTNVDVVTGATYTSKGIMSAVEDALNQAAQAVNNEGNSTSNSNNTSRTNDSSQQSTNKNTNTVENNTEASNNIKNVPSTTQNESNQKQASSNQAPASSSNSGSSTSSKYKDGQYTGQARGFRPGLTVSVTVKSDKITNIKITAINDTPGYYDEPVNLIPNEIIQSQSTNVDAVSGATYTSKGIMNAVANALNQAKK